MLHFVLVSQFWVLSNNFLKENIEICLPSTSQTRMLLALAFSYYPSCLIDLRVHSLPFLNPLVLFFLDHARIHRGALQFLLILL